MKNEETVDDDEERSEGFIRIYEFFTRYVRRIHPDTHWKRAMKMNPNVVWFQLITPSDIAFVISLIKNGMPVWKRKTALFESDDLRKTKAKPLFTSGEGQKRSFGKTTWSKEGLQYFHKVEATWQEAYSDKEQMSDLVNGWEKWEPTDDLKKGKDLLRTNWTIKEINKKGTGRGEDDDDEGWDDKSGYHSDKYDDVVDFELDNANLKKVTGLKKLVGEEDAISEESDDDGVHKDVDAVAAGNKGGDMVSEEKDEVGEPRKSARHR
jgi:hypothetical protein